MTYRPDKISARNFADAPFFKHFPRFAGIGVALLGVAVIIGWFMHWTTLIQLLPSLPPMKFNTALCFTFCGAGLILLTTQRAEIASVPGALMAAVGFLTLLEYLAGKTFVLDELFVRDYIHVATTFPGRMSPLAASCFLFLGTALALAGWQPQSKWQLTIWLGRIHAHCDAYSLRIFDLWIGFAHLGVAGGAARPF
jgi:hypothetical protein